MVIGWDISEGIGPCGPCSSRVGFYLVGASCIVSCWQHGCSSSSTEEGIQGLPSNSPHTLPKLLCCLSQPHRFEFSATHIPGRENVAADELSLSYPIGLIVLHWSACYSKVYSPANWNHFLACFNLLGNRLIIISSLRTFPYHINTIYRELSLSLWWGWVSEVGGIVYGRLERWDPQISREGAWSVKVLGMGSP